VQPNRTLAKSLSVPMFNPRHYKEKKRNYRTVKKKRTGSDKKKNRLFAWLMSKIQKSKAGMKEKGEKPVRRQAWGTRGQKKNGVCY